MTEVAQAPAKATPGVSERFDPAKVKPAETQQAQVTVRYPATIATTPEEVERQEPGATPNNAETIAFINVHYNDTELADSYFRVRRTAPVKDPKTGLRLNVHEPVIDGLALSPYGAVYDQIKETLGGGRFKVQICGKRGVEMQFDVDIPVTTNPIKTDDPAFLDTSVAGGRFGAPGAVSPVGALGAMFGGGTEKTEEQKKIEAMEAKIELQKLEAQAEDQKEELAEKREAREKRKDDRAMQPQIAALEQRMNSQILQINTAIDKIGSALEAIANNNNNNGTNVMSVMLELQKAQTSAQAEIAKAEAEREKARTQRLEKEAEERAKAERDLRQKEIEAEERRQAKELESRKELATIQLAAQAKAEEAQQKANETMVNMLTAKLQASEKHSTEMINRMLEQKLEDPLEGILKYKQFMDMLSPEAGAEVNPDAGPMDNLLNMILAGLAKKFGGQMPGGMPAQLPTNVDATQPTLPAPPQGTVVPSFEAEVPQAQAPAQQSARRPQVANPPAVQAQQSPEEARLREIVTGLMQIAVEDVKDKRAQHRWVGEAVGELHGGFLDALAKFDSSNPEGVQSQMQVLQRFCHPTVFNELIGLISQRENYEDGFKPFAGALDTVVSMHRERRGQ